ncbi:hypothetical protein [Streptomyces iranensis]|uniref:Uncharacterized protein n=1 Tax=Streptomyces iranensis TaxID=576784 RepID=A0A060ZV25_9ACTN|nr:hypothetical protein [Streptomyces iranensis]MBP2067752.1 hypothetical protein [Streptomyces iranensis]CDR06907.1 predicted protein [Streptomyces iranensis]
MPDRNGTAEPWGKAATFFQAPGLEGEFATGSTLAMTFLPPVGLADEADAACGAEYGQVNDEHVNHRNGDSLP